MLPADQASHQIECGTEAESGLTAWAEERKDKDDGAGNEYGLKMCMYVRYPLWPASYIWWIVTALVGGVTHLILGSVDQALDWGVRTAERVRDSAHPLTKSMGLVGGGDLVAAEERFREAITIAQKQSAKWWE